MAAISQGIESFCWSQPLAMASRLWDGGGVFDFGTLVMRGASSIHHNTVPTHHHGGGIKNHAGDPLDGVVCGLGGNVHDNQPDDCYQAP